MRGCDGEKGTTTTTITITTNNNNSNNNNNNNILSSYANLQRTATEEKEITQIKAKHVSIVEDKDVVFNQQQYQITPYDNKNHRATEEQEKQNAGKDFSKLEKLASFIIALLGLALSQFSISGLVCITFYILTYPTLPGIQEEFSTSETITNAVVASTVVIGGIVPAIWAAISDKYGRRPIFMAMILTAILGNIASAFSINIEMLITLRAITSIGTGGCSPIGTGVIVDVFNDRERGRALSWYTAMPVIFTIFAPITCGLLSQYFGWRSVFFFYTACYLLLFIAVVFLLPETNPQKRFAVTKQKGNPVVGNRSQTWLEHFSIINPFASLKLLKYQDFFLTASYVALCMGANYAANTSFTWAYSKRYHFNSTIVGLCFIAGGFGYCLGATVAGILSDRLYQSRVTNAKETGKEIYPEMRLSLPTLAAGIFTMAGGYMSYGWCVEMNVHFAFGMISQMFAQFGVMLWVCFLTVYATQCFPNHGASVQACFQLLKHLCMTILLMTVVDLQKLLGYGALYSIVGGVLIMASAFVIYIKSNKSKWRRIREQT